MGTTFCGFTLKNGSSATCPARCWKSLISKQPRVELGLAGGAAGTGLGLEPARRVVEHHVAARRKPGVVEVPGLAAAEVRALPGVLVARATAVHERDQRVSARRRGRRGTRDVDVERHEPVRVGARHAVGVGGLRRQALEAVVFRRHPDASHAADVRGASERRRVAVVADARTCIPARPCAPDSWTSGLPESRPARQPRMQACRRKTPAAANQRLTRGDPNAGSDRRVNQGHGTKMPCVRKTSLGNGAREAVRAAVEARSPCRAARSCACPP